MAVEWRDEGVLLSARPHGESAAVIEVLTAAHGRHAGVVPGGASRRMAPVLQPGAQLDLVWRARLDAHIGTFRAEPLGARAASLMGDRRALAGLGSVCALCLFALPERATCPDFYHRTGALLDAMAAGPGWEGAYLNWELRFLEEVGLGLDLSGCAVLGHAANDLSYVSPRTGRAVSRAGAGAWADRLLPLPACLIGGGAPSAEDLMQGLALTGHFLHHHLAPQLGDRPMPQARARLVARLALRPTP